MVPISLVISPEYSISLEVEYCAVLFRSAIRNGSNRSHNLIAEHLTRQYSTYYSVSYKISSPNVMPLWSLLDLPTFTLRYNRMPISFLSSSPLISSLSGSAPSSGSTPIASSSVSSSVSSSPLSPSVV